jgi:hypothetical protein
VPAIPQLSIRFILQGRPQRPVRNSFDHLVGASEQRDRQRVQAERLGGFQIDDQVELGRVLHRQIGRLLALEDAVDIGRCKAGKLDIVDTRRTLSRRSRPNSERDRPRAGDAALRAR